MDRIIDKSLSEMAGLRFSCSCGREHSVEIERIIIGYDIDAQILDTVKAFKEGTILVVCDTNTKKVKGEAVIALLVNAGFQTKSHSFSPEGHTLVPDEKAVGRLLIEIDSKIALIIAVGSGTINDLCRFVSSRTGIPYLIVGTAPSMDGYASTVSPLIVEGFKKTYEAHAPLAIIGDLNCMANAPSHMVCAGFGDIMGKFTALSDWALSAKINNEYYCEETVDLVNKAIGRCVENAEGIAVRDERAIQYLIEALILSGVAMGLVGNSRPASGAEHHLAHFWEMDALKKKADHPLHGNMVGVGTIVIASIYRLIDQKQPLGLALPDPDMIRALLAKVGSPVSPKALGVSREVFHESILHAKEIRPRYTVLHLAEKLGMLEEAALKLTEEYYAD